MGIYEPPPLEVTITKIVGRLIAPFYRRYVESLPLQGSEKVLDYGTGSGLCSRFLARRLQKDGGLLVCMDVSQTWQSVSRQVLRRYENVTFVFGKVQETRLPAASMDAVFVHFTLHEVSRSKRGLVAAVLTAALKPGGKLFIREPEQERGNEFPTAEIRAVLQAQGLVELSATEEQRWFTGPMFRAVYQKPA